MITILKRLSEPISRRFFTAVLLIAAIVLVGCQGQSFLESISPSAAPAQPVINPTELPPGQTQAEVITPTATTPDNIHMVIWVPAQFSPYEETPAAQVLTQHLKDFRKEYPQVNLDIRVKAASGAGGMLDTLISASQVAPDALPALALLSRGDLEQAAQLGLLQPIEEVSTIIDEEDWFGFARAVGIVQGTAYGLPFAADVLGLIYRESASISSQPTWEEVTTQLSSLVFPAADPNIQATLALYLSAGGSLQDPQGQPFIDVAALTTTLEAYERAKNNGRFAETLLNLQTDDQAWENFQTSQAEGILAWTSRLQQSDEDLRIAALPTLGDEPASLARGWSWCLVEKESPGQTYAGLLAEYLVQPDFLYEWAPLSGFLPVRPSSVSAWENPVFEKTISSMLESAQLRPGGNQTSAFNLGIQTAIQEVLSGISQPTESALKAAQNLEIVE